jgi:8-amino-7-oxononanoate synthase
MPPLDEFAAQKLAALEQASLRRRLVTTARTEGIWVDRGGRRLLSFSCNDYLGLTQHPALKAAAIAAIEAYGVGAGASRLVTGDHPLYPELEVRLARFKNTESACVFGSGYLANAGVAQVLVGRGDLILIDELAHSSLWAGARLSRADIHAFRHNDISHVAALLSEHRAGRRNTLIITESVFSMDGDRASLNEIIDLANRFDAWLMVDDAHDLLAGSEHSNAPLRIGTLSKALGGYGGYLCASATVIELMRNRARTLIYSTGLPPAVVAAAIAALDLIEREPALLARPLINARIFTRAAGLPDAESAIVPVVVGEAAAALDASRILEREGYLVVAIRPPTVPANTARLRLAFSALHPESELERLAEIVRMHILDRDRKQPRYKLV